VAAAAAAVGDGGLRAVASEGAAAADAAADAAAAAATAAAAWLRWRRDAAAAAAARATRATTAPPPPVTHEAHMADAVAFAATADAIVAGGASSLTVIMDFDRTITTHWADESRTARGATCHGIVESTRGAGLLAKCRELNERFYPIEVDADTPLAVKIPAMEDWYTSVHNLLIADGLQRADVATSVAAARLRLRRGVPEIFDWCDRHAVPLLVFSAGIGDVLVEVLRQRLPGGLPPCVHVVSNMMRFDPASGALVGFSDLIHMFNKTAAVLGPAALRALSGRPCVLLAGDSLGDASMAHGLPAVAHELRFGFLNDASTAGRLLPQFMARFDCVLTDDAPATPLLALLQRIAP
jgi:5'-nucleotidase